MMCQRRGLGLLEMGESGHDSIRILFHDLKDLREQRRQQRAGLIDLVTDIKLHVQGNLVVSAPAGVQTLPGIADPLRQRPLDEGMDVLVVRIILKGQGPVLQFLRDLRKSLKDGLPVLFTDDLPVRQHRRVGDTSADILPPEALIEGQGFVEFLSKAVCLLCKSSAPEFHSFSSMISAEA